MNLSLKARQNPGPYTIWDGEGANIETIVRYYKSQILNSKFYFDTGELTDDIVGHELTHGVVQTLCPMGYGGESGAINEGLADVFGEYIDQLNYESRGDNGTLIDRSDDFRVYHQDLEAEAAYDATNDYNGEDARWEIGEDAFITFRDGTQRKGGDKKFEGSPQIQLP